MFHYWFIRIGHQDFTFLHLLVSPWLSSLSSSIGTFPLSHLTDFRTCSFLSPPPTLFLSPPPSSLPLSLSLHLSFSVVRFQSRLKNSYVLLLEVNYPGPFFNANVRLFVPKVSITMIVSERFLVRILLIFVSSKPVCEDIRLRKRLMFKRAVSPTLLLQISFQTSPFCLTLSPMST